MDLPINIIWMSPLSVSVESRVILYFIHIFAFCGITSHSGAILFTYVPQKGRQLFSFPAGVYVGTLNLIASIPDPSILTLYELRSIFMFSGTYSVFKAFRLC